MNDIADFVTKHADVQPYLPDGKEVQKVPKAWIGNVCATILGDTFTKWISFQVEERNKKLVVEKGLAIEMDPKIAEAFYASTKTSGKYLARFSAHFLFPSQYSKALAFTCSRRTQNGAEPRPRSCSKSKTSLLSKTPSLPSSLGLMSSSQGLLRLISS